MTNKIDRSDQSLIKFLHYIVLIGGIFLILEWYWNLCIKLTPRNRNLALTLSIAIAIPIALYSGFVIFDRPESHPSASYSPSQWRTLVARKCVTELHANGVQFKASCVGLDEPDIPMEIQAQLTNREYAARAFDLYFVSESIINIERYHSNDPSWFIHPEILWSDGTKPSTPLLSF